MPYLKEERTHEDGTIWVTEYCDGCSTTSSRQKGTPFPHSSNEYGFECPLALYDEIDSLRAENKLLEDKLAVLGGEWCAENRAEGRGGCGACALCCKELFDKMERMRAALLHAQLVIPDNHNTDCGDLGLLGQVDHGYCNASLMREITDLVGTEPVQIEDLKDQALLVAEIKRLARRIRGLENELLPKKNQLEFFQQQLKKTERHLRNVMHAATCQWCGTQGGSKAHGAKEDCTCPIHQYIRNARLFLGEKTTIHAPECDCDGDVFCTKHFQEVLDIVNEPPRVIPALRDALVRHKEMEQKVQYESGGLCTGSDPNVCYSSSGKCGHHPEKP